NVADSPRRLQCQRCGMVGVKFGAGLYQMFQRGNCGDMNPSFESLARIAEIEFSEIVSDSAPMGEKLRLLLNDTSYIDIWLSHTQQSRTALAFTGKDATWMERFTDMTISPIQNGAR
ncbi:MAG: hypothetical protein COS37_07390, partial [Anaerolineae bacterium CG03_land_8_20_14_0_80_58_20]